MAFLAPLLGAIAGPIIQGITGLFHGHGLNPYMSRCCGAPTVGGELAVNSQGHLHHKVSCGNCGKKHTVRHTKAMSQKIVQHLISPEGMQMLKHHADLHGEGFFDMLKPALGSLASAVLPKATAWLGNKVGTFVDSKLGSQYGDLARSGISKLGQVGQDLANKHLGSGPQPLSFATQLQTGSGANSFTKWEHDHKDHMPGYKYKPRDEYHAWMMEHAGHDAHGEGVWQDFLHGHKDKIPGYEYVPKKTRAKSAPKAPSVPKRKTIRQHPLRDDSETISRIPEGDGAWQEFLTSHSGKIPGYEYAPKKGHSQSHNHRALTASLLKAHDEMQAEHFQPWEGEDWGAEGSGAWQDYMKGSSGHFKGYNYAPKRAPKAKSHASGDGVHHNPWIAYKQKHSGVPLRELSVMYHKEKMGHGFFP